MKKSAFITAIAVLAAASSCSKDSDTTTTPSLRGISMNSPIPYVAIGATLEFKAEVGSITTSDGSTASPIGLYWNVNSALRDTLTRDISTSNPVFRYTADTAGVYNVYCYAFAENYYNTSTNATFRAIDPDTALSGLSGERTENVGGSLYRTTEAGGKTWLAENLHGGGHTYSAATVLETVLGNYYTWEEALTACPDGWHLPAPEEFDTLGTDACALMADASFLEDTMWEYWPGMVITNSLGFNAIPAGYMVLPSDYQEKGFGQYAAWWTADAVDEDLATFRYIIEDKPQVQKSQGSKQALALSVRCVKD